jgi:hypothetical protein
MPRASKFQPHNHSTAHNSSEHSLNLQHPITIGKTACTHRDTCASTLVNLYYNCKPSDCSIPISTLAIKEAKRLIADQANCFWESVYMCSSNGTIIYPSILGFAKLLLWFELVQGFQPIQRFPEILWTVVTGAGKLFYIFLSGFSQKTFWWYPSHTEATSKNLLHQ